MAITEFQGFDLNCDVEGCVVSARHWGEIPHASGLLEWLADQDWMAWGKHLLCPTHAHGYRVAAHFDERALKEGTA